jgi:hypothetical protein
MHLRELEKTPSVAFGRYGFDLMPLQGQGYQSGRFAIRPRTDFIAKQENCCSFLDIYDRVGRSAARPRNFLAGSRVCAMSAEVPTPNAGKLHPQVVRTNRRQVLLFAALTLILTAGGHMGRAHLAKEFRDPGVCLRRPTATAAPPSSAMP